MWFWMIATVWMVLVLAAWVLVDRSLVSPRLVELVERPMREV
jgi:p-aminobenzoyl-glutamate transporter AbgT